MCRIISPLCHKSKFKFPGEFTNFLQGSGIYCFWDSWVEWGSISVKDWKHHGNICSSSFLWWYSDSVCCNSQLQKFWCSRWTLLQQIQEGQPGTDRVVNQRGLQRGESYVLHGMIETQKTCYFQQLWVFSNHKIIRCYLKLCCTWLFPRSLSGHIWQVCPCKTYIFAAVPKCAFLQLTASFLTWELHRMTTQPLLLVQVATGQHLQAQIGHTHLLGFVDLRQVKDWLSLLLISQLAHHVDSICLLSA